MPNNAKIESHEDIKLVHSLETDFMEGFRFMPRKDNFTIPVTRPVFNQTVPDIQLLKLQIPDFKTIWEETFAPVKSIPHALRVLSIMFPIVIVLIICCCVSKRFKDWWKTFWHCRNPLKYQRDYKGYTQPNPLEKDPEFGTRRKLMK